MTTVPEVIAKLDVFERDLLNMVARIREFRYDLFASVQAEDLDNDLGDLLE